METGKIVYYFEHREIMSGICLSEKDNSYHLLLPGSKEINLQKKGPFTSHPILLI